jgi:hypothetical protein
MTDQVPDMSPSSKARAAAVYSLLTLLLGVLAQVFISERLVVWGDAEATAANILAHRLMFQSGFAIYLAEMACQVAATLLFYELLKPVNKSMSLLAATLGLVGIAIKALSRLFFIAPLFVLGGAHYLSVFTAPQLDALALILLKVNDQGAGMGLAFFGFAGVLKGILLYRSTFLPRILGLLAGLTGLFLLTYLYPPLGNQFFGLTAMVGLVASVSLIGWLLLFGVDEERWRVQARAMLTRVEYSL